MAASPHTLAESASALPGAERACLWIAGVFGLAFALLTPPLQVPDEHRHLARSYALSEGRLGIERDRERPSVSVPRSVGRMAHRQRSEHANGKLDLDYWRRELAYPLQPEQLVPVWMPGLLSPLPYLPQLLAVGLLRLLESPAIVILYGARLANLAAFLALLGLTLRIAPSHRVSLGLLALTPMSLFLAGSMSPDVVTHGSAFVWIALVLRARVRPGPLGRGELLTLTLAAGALGLCKIVYWILVALLLLVPAARFPSRRARILQLGGIVALSLVPTLLWGAFTVASGSPTPELTDRAQRIEWLLAHPLAYLGILIETLSVESVRYVRQWIGVLGWLDVPLPVPVYVALPALLTWIARNESPVRAGGQASGWTRAERLLLLGLVAVGWGLLVSVAFVDWTPAEERIVRSVQGRYLIPFAPLLALALQRANATGVPNRLVLAGLAASVAACLAGLSALWSRYYGP